MIKGPEELTDALRQLLRDNPRREALGARARSIMNANTGAAYRTFELVRPFIR
jgi:hypothetical protein